MNFKNEYELQLDLAEHLRSVGYLTYTEIEIKSGRGGRADVVAIKPTYANKDCRIYEVKNNRATFDNDNKFEKYFDVCHRMYIACPKGMISKEELPPKVGLIVRGENGWYVVKAAKRSEPKNFNIDFALSLLYRGYEESEVQRRLRDRIIAEENMKLSKKVKNIGFEIARRLDNNRETEVEEWVKKINSLFKEKLNVDISVRNNLPCIWDIEHVLDSISGVSKEASNIRKIGEYLMNLDSEEEGKSEYRNLNNLRDRALRGIS